MSRRPVVLAGVFIGYIALSQAGFALAGLSTVAPPFRPASGLALAALIAFGLRTWPAVLVAALVVTVGATSAPQLSIVMAIGHTLAAVAGAALIARFAKGRDVFRSVVTTLRAVFFMLVAAGVPVILLAIFSLWQSVPEAAGWSALLSAWLGQVTGALVVAPCALIMFMTDVERPTRQDWRIIGEAAALLLSVSVVALAVFAGFIPSDVKTYPLEFLCLPFLLWAAFRFGPREVTMVVAILASVAVWGTLRRVGPFADNAPTEAVWLLQAYVAVMSITGIAFATAVDERRRAEAQLQELATTDPLTGLVNYRRLLDVLRMEVARSRRSGRPFALLLVDMDGLKKINDRLGHLAGSRAICRVADVLRKSTRESDVVSRFGGDEFAVVLPESSDDGGTAVMARVCAKLAQDAGAPVLSVSGGHAVFPRDGDSPTLLLRAADRQLYAAKHRGGEGSAIPELTAVSA